MFRNSPNIISNCVYQSSISIKWLQEILQQLDGDYGECTMKNSLADWVGYRAGMQCFPVYLLYRIHEKFNDAFNFLLTSCLVCVQIIEPDTVVMIFEGLMGKKMLALRLRTPAS